MLTPLIYTSKQPGRENGEPKRLHQDVSVTRPPGGLDTTHHVSRITYGIETMPIHMRILPQVLHLLENLKFYSFLSLQCQFTMYPRVPIFFLISGTGVMILSI